MWRTPSMFQDAMHCIFVSILEAKEIQNLSWLLEMMKIRWVLGHQLCHTELLQWNRLTMYRGNSSQLSSWKMLRSISGLYDTSILLKSTWFQTSWKEYATHQCSTPLNIHSEVHQMEQQKYPTRRNFRSTWIYKANFSIFPISLLYCLSNIRTRKAWIHWLNIPWFPTFSITQ